MRNFINIINEYQGLSLEKLKSLVNFDDADPKVAEHVKHILTFFYNKGYKVSGGRHRFTFIKNNHIVFKVPYNWAGVGANNNEYDVFRKDNDGIPMARCKEIYFDKKIGIPVLAMEYVKHMKLKDKKGKELPWWTSWVDSGQYGYNNHGRLVAYDM